MGSTCSKQKDLPVRAPQPGPGKHEPLMPPQQAADMAEAAQQQLKKQLRNLEDAQHRLEEDIASQSEKAGRLKQAGKTADMAQELKIAQMLEHDLGRIRNNILKTKERQAVVQQQRLDWLQHNIMVSVAPNFLHVDIDAASRANAQLEENNSYARAAGDTVADESEYTKEMDVEELERKFLSNN
ncbi:hypothetical protein DUNSADRAFT_11319 [Dunaliella salina]|uniref:Uncharacterized protein n=1 Tax=Dunaliella salina TaxID=3046 RepID=A0ABQ7H4I0_DUNSA|nr:hypothetical protein DUNSADRAFT_11319 [Dunaliella salina]|eukprot:KAF5841760.1 hypothetical protein DUNSADRAFT_11319 [Dunaliella salina]